MTALDRIAVVLPGRIFAAVKPATVGIEQAVALAAEWSEPRLTVIDGAHPALRAAFPGADPVPRAEVLDWLRTLPRLASAPGVWTVRSATGTLTAPLRAPTELALVPDGPPWLAADRPEWVTVDVDGVVVEYHRPPVASARDAVLDLLDLLIGLTRQSPRTVAVVGRLLAGQPLSVLKLTGEGYQRYPVSHKRVVTAASLDDLDTILWDRRGSGGHVHLIEPGAPRVAPEVIRTKSGATVLPLGRLLSLAGDLAEPVPRVPLAVLGPDGQWATVPAAVERDELRWTVDADPAELVGRPVRRLVLRRFRDGDDDVLVYDVGPDRDLADAITWLHRVTGGLGTGRDLTVPPRFQQTVVPPAVQASPPPAVQYAVVDSLATAVAQTRAYALDWLGARHVPVDRDAVDHVMHAMLRSRPDLAQELAFVEALDRVGVEDLEARHYGAQAVALLVLDRELDLMFHKDKAFSIGVFARALTAYLVAVTSVSLETWPWTWQRIVRYVREYLQGRRLPAGRAHTLTAKDFPGKAQQRWERLATEIPWIRWLAPHDRDPVGGTRLRPGDVIDTLVLLRPRQVPVLIGRDRRYSPDTGVRIEPVPRRFHLLYCRGSGVPEAQLDTLADALSTLLNDPAQTARSAQALTLPAEVAAELQARIALAVERRAAPEQVLAVRVDDAASPRVILANLSGEHALDARLDDDTAVRLPPLAVEQPGAFNYCGRPQRIEPGSELEIGTTRLSLAVDRVPLTEGANVTLAALPDDLFRGREEQLAQLRRAIGGSGPRAGSLIFGTRRAGKSALAWRAGQNPPGQDRRLRGSLWVDLSNASESARSDFRAWNQAICHDLARQAHRRLGIRLDGDATDFIGLLADLDEQLDGGAPVVVILDELDMLLLPEQGSAGRRAAGRLGNLAWDNLVLIGTVQRFHRSVHEFKNWSSIECPADLSWADGVTYFFGPLADRTPGPRVEWLRRAAVTPEDYANEIVPLVGLRPYFWAQLRNRLEGHISGDRDSRLLSTTALRPHLQALITGDPHLNSVIDRGGGLDPDEYRRRDLFSDDERRILARFAAMPAKKSHLMLAEAVALGGDQAVNDLIDRAYLTFTDNATRLATAVPIYHHFLRARSTELHAVLNA